MRLKDILYFIKHMHFAEFWWTITNFTIVIPVWKISKKAEQKANEIAKTDILDGVINGGQVDAFRHCLWMAMLTQKIGPKRARKLGLIHEKGNKKDFEKKILEEDKLPDATSVAMDLLNNEIGISIGLNFPNISEKSLIEEVIKYVLTGKCWIIKTDQNGNFLDKESKIIPEEKYLGKWNTPKVLVASNYGKETNGKLRKLGKHRF